MSLRQTVNVPAQGFGRKGAATETLRNFRTIQEKTNDKHTLSQRAYRFNRLGKTGIDLLTKDSPTGAANAIRRRGLSVYLMRRRSSKRVCHPSFPTKQCDKSAIAGPGRDLHALARRVSRIAGGDFRIRPVPPFRHNRRRCLGPCDPGQQANENSRPSVYFITVPFFAVRGEAAVAMQ